MKIRQLKQTNRTILFAEINGKKDSLKTLLGEESDVKSISDDLLNKIDENLCVSSFDEFIDKFKPTIYSRFTADESLEYSLSPKDTEGWFTHPINMSNSFLKTVINVVEGKTTKNIEFNYENCLELLGVEKQSDGIAQVREELSLLLEKYQNAEEDSPEQEKYGELCDKKLGEIVRDYCNPLAILPDRIDRLGLLIEKNNEPQDYVEQLPKGNGDGVVEFDETGRLMISEKESILKDEDNIEILDEDGNVVDSDENEGEESKFTLALKQEYELYVQKNNKPTTKNMGQMLAKTFMPQYLPAEVREYDENKSKTELVEEYNYIQDIVNKSLKQFVKEAKALIEIIVGVKVFFDQSKAKNNKMLPSLVVSNCTIDKLDEKILSPYLVATNHTHGNVDKAIWFSIIPNVEMSSVDDVTEEVPTSGFFKRKKSSNSKKIVTSKSEMTRLVKVLAGYEIQSFVGFENSEKNTFQYVSQHGVNGFIEITESIRNNKDINTYVIPCLPNMTIIPENKSVAEKTKKYVMDDEQAKSNYETGIRIGGVYISASFLAAGIVAACQSSEFLASKKLKVELGLPGVRFDIEKYASIVESTVGVEIAGYSDEVESEINSKQFGFIFKSGENTSQLKVMTARCMCQDDNEVFEPLFKQLTSTYIKRFLKNSCDGDVDKASIKEFFEGTTKAVFWDKLKSEKCVNALLQDNDKIEHKEDKTSCKISLTLKGVEKGLEIEMTNA